LPAGTYRFVIYAANSDGIYNPAPRELLITITPPFYKTWWFITLIALLAIGIVAYIIYLRFSKTLELQRVRLKLYENLHDDVGSRLTAIVLSAEEIERNEKWNHPKLLSIANIARSIVGNMRRLVWAIDPENDRMVSILQRINYDGGVILGDKIQLELNIPDALKSMVVPGEIRYQMASICNEAFNNIAKYARAKMVTLTITREGRNLKLSIHDDGIGFDPAEQARHTVSGSGYGLNNMRKRAARVKGQLHIESKPGEGTIVEAVFPLS
jgi:signal transduction histidine kinase